MKAEKSSDEKYDNLKRKYNELLSKLTRKFRILQKPARRRSGIPKHQNRASRKRKLRFENTK